MFLRVLIFTMLAFGLSGFGVVAYLATRSQTPAPVVEAARAPEPERPPPEPAKASILVAGKALRAGSLVRPEDLTTQTLASSAIPPGAIAATTEGRVSVAGAMLRRSYQANEPLVAGTMLQTTDRGFLAAVLAPGTRAVSVAVDPVLSGGGLVWPGDHVDMLLTQAIEAPNTSLGRRVVGETVLTDLRIVAVDRALVQGAVSDTSDVTSGATGPRTVTVEVTPPQAERLAVASRIGRLALSIRAATTAMDERADLARPAVWAKDVSTVLGDQPAASSGVSVFGGSAEKKEYKF